MNLKTCISASFCAICLVLTDVACQGKGSTFSFTVQPDPLETIDRDGKDITVSAAVNSGDVTATLEEGSDGKISSVIRGIPVPNEPPIPGGLTQKQSMGSGSAKFNIYATDDGDDNVIFELRNANEKALESKTMPYETDDKVP